MIYLILNIVKIQMPIGYVCPVMERDDNCGEPSDMELPDIDGKAVYVVDSIEKTGRTMRAVMDTLIDYGRPAVIRYFTPINIRQRELPIQTDADSPIQVDFEPIDQLEVLEGDSEDGSLDEIIYASELSKSIN